MNSLEVYPLKVGSDSRGDSFFVPTSVFHYIGTIHEMHYVTIEPGKVRGNHYHRGRKEFVILIFHGTWKLAWRSLGTGSVNTRDFNGRGGVILQIDSEVVHAIKNTGDSPLHLVSCSNARSTLADTSWEVILE